ncbi:hypothetical protein MTR_6g033605 [Medicago truncatula]|uniref:Uncharacterized protein n=1 Tax=Medicago truncatula TaxID=3880 RepID=A0A072U7N1_MEDTR|nr:hypothetical protein MTR_6g033605 [Medicago truncatula]
MVCTLMTMSLRDPNKNMFEVKVHKKKGKVIAWFGFSEDALMLKTANWLSSIDHYGSIWRCEMVFIMVDNTLFCSIGGDWKSFCEARNLVKGHAIKLGATENTTSGILHIRHVS